MSLERWIAFVAASAVLLATHGRKMHRNAHRSLNPLPASIRGEHFAIREIRVSDRFASEI